MAEYTNVIIGIQARSTSTRLPGKCDALIGGIPMILHVIRACAKAALYVNSHSNKTKTLVRTCLLVPKGDRLAQNYHKQIQVLEGDEHDVLSRYVQLAKREDASYIVRVTGDCPLIPPYLITKHIKIAKINGYDYVSNVDIVSRTAIDGIDCEVMSARALDWLDENATGKHREHVTLLMREKPPEWAVQGTTVGFLNLSDMKLSVDTEEDLERVRHAYERVQTAVKKAEEKYGKQNLHRF